MSQHHFTLLNNTHFFPDIAKIILEKRPELAREADNISRTPVRQAVLFGKIEMLRVMLEHDSTLGYEIGSNGDTLLDDSTYRGHGSSCCCSRAIETLP